MKSLFNLKSNYQPTGDQPVAIKQLVTNLKNNVKEQTLLGATGTGKTFTIANVITQVNKPTLVLAHNKTLAGQLYAELKSFFPDNHVEYFISYYDYYQPEAYIPSKDTYIEKDSSINDEIDQLRHSATMSILEHRDTIIVASVSCIYGIGDPEDYKKSLLLLRKNDQLSRNKLIEDLVNMQFNRNDYELKRGTFRVKGDNVDILPTYQKSEAIRICFFDDEIEKIVSFDTVTGKLIASYEFISIYPATQFVTNNAKIEEAISRIKDELEQQLLYFNDNGMFLEAQRIRERTNYDLEMISEVGYCSGIENYSRHLSLKDSGETPSVLLDFFNGDYLLVVDESHVTLPQVRGMYNGDRSRKETLVEYGFRLPSALDNRPLTFDEFVNKIDQVIYVSATPGDYELNRSYQVIEQIIRPTGLLDPIVEVLPTYNQIDQIIKLIRERIDQNERTLITTLTIRMSEELTRYLKEIGIKVAYLHSEIKTLERLEIIRKLRIGDYDCLVGINLLREGLDLPEVSLICILDADKEGFLRSSRSLIQIIGRAARNKNGKVIMFANKMTDSMSYAINETNRRRLIQEAYNQENGIVPETIKKEIGAAITIVEEISSRQTIDPNDFSKLTNLEKRQLIDVLETQMRSASHQQNFEEAMLLRDTIIEIKASMR